MQLLVDGRSGDELNMIETANTSLLNYTLEKKDRTIRTGLLKDFEDYVIEEVEFFDYDVQIEIDLDYDGVKETVKVWYEEEDYKFTVYVEINGVQIEHVYFVYSVSEQFAVGKVGDMKCIFVSAVENYFDYTYMYGWQSGSVIDYDFTIGGIISPEKTTIRIDNSGDNPIFTFQVFYSLIQTWFVQESYLFDGNTFVKVIPEYGYYLMEYPAFLMEDLIVLADMDRSTGFIMTGMQQIYFTGIINDLIRITDEKGQSGFIQISGGSYIINNGQYIDISDIFLGFDFAG